MANQDYIAIYPVSPCLQIGDEKINMFENLAKFKDQLVQSMKGVLEGKRQAMLIRIAHVGLKTGQKELVEDKGYYEGISNKQIHSCEHIYKAQQTCYFVPIIGKSNEDKGEHSKVGYLVNSGRSTQSPTITYEYGFHADPLIFARISNEENKDLVESITYGENAEETMLAWLEIPFMDFDEETPGNSVDAYVLFNSTFYMADYGIDFQVIHGGFKAEEWDDISCFRRCSELKNYRHRVEVNPHWLRRDSNRILMIIGEESTWFFSMPIAPPPFFFKTGQGYDKLIKSTQMIKELLQTDYDLRLADLIEKLKLKDYDNGTVTHEASSFVKWYMNKGEKGNPKIAHNLPILNAINVSKEQVARQFLKEFGFTPQITEEDLNYSHLDLYLTKPKEGWLKPSWYIAILLLLLIDTYHETMKERFEQVCDQM